MVEIYYIEDDESIARAVKAYLEAKFCAVKVFPSVAEARRAVTERLPSLVLIDWNLPGEQGDAFCGWIRETWRTLPIILLTVRGDSSDIVSGFQSGADDYVVKPFALEVLYSRVRALLRRTERAEEARYACGDIRLDAEKKIAYVQNRETALSQTEYQLLVRLIRNQGITLTRGQLLAEIWDQHGNYVNDNTLTVSMKRLREKLNNPSCLKTIRSFGYRMEEDE